MAFRFDPEVSVRREVRRVVAERLGTAISTLESLDGAPQGGDHGNGDEDSGPPGSSTAPDVVQAVHTVRKRCKEVRGLAQLVRPELGRDFDRFNTLVRDAAAELAAFRDAHAGLATFEHLLAGFPATVDDEELQRLRGVLHEAAEEATRAATASDPRLGHAHTRLVEARDRAARWKVSKDFTALAGGLHDTYRRARRRHRDVAAAPDDESVHEWRKAVKQLWYQARLVEPAAPSVLSTLVDRLDDLSEALGDDHDLAVLIERFGADPDAFGGHRVVERTTVLARLEQDDLRGRALRSGATIFAERPKAFTARVAAYWALTAEEGPERPTGGIVAVHADDRAAADGAATPDASEGGSDDQSAGDVERERKFLVDRRPDLHDDGTRLRQGYLAIEHPVSVRIREARDECTLTLKAGSGSTRTELEWPIAAETFETLWEHTGDRRVAKTRHRIAHGDHTIELDVFHDALDGLVVAEVEFASDDEMATFEPPDWFGEDVTDDHRYTNAWLAEHGLDDLPTGADAGGDEQDHPADHS